MEWSFSRREKRSARSFCIGRRQAPCWLICKIMFAWDHDSGSTASFAAMPARRCGMIRRDTNEAVVMTSHLEDARAE
jgi:hypothetical protein